MKINLWTQIPFRIYAPTSRAIKTHSLSLPTKNVNEHGKLSLSPILHYISNVIKFPLRTVRQEKVLMQSAAIWIF